MDVIMKTFYRVVDMVSATILISLAAIIKNIIRKSAPRLLEVQHFIQAASDIALNMVGNVCINIVVVCRTACIRGSDSMLVAA